MDHDLDRFVAAQAGVFDTALAELRAGAKRTHWMWFVFPQIAGLGQSDMARRYAIRSLEEARAYLAHPVLGARYDAAVAALLPHRHADPAAVMGGIGNLRGAVLGGLIIGIIQNISDARIGPQWTPAIVFGYLVMIMVLRPRGLLGEETREAG